MAIKEEKKLISCLSNEVVQVKFIPRRRGDLTDDPKHIAYGGMLDTSFKEYGVKRLKNGQYKNVLTNDEKDFLENLLGLEPNTLSIYNREYWKKRKVRIKKTGLTLDLSDPQQYIDYKLLLTNDARIAASIEDKGKRRTYQFYIEREGEQEAAKAKKLNSSKEAYKLFGKYEDNKEVLKYALRMLGRATRKDVKISTLQTTIGDIIDNNPASIVDILGDRLLQTKVLIDTAVTLGVLTKRADEYFDSENNPLADKGITATLQEAAEYLNQPRNQEIKFTIEARVKQVAE